MWLDCDTALSSGGFIAQQVGLLIGLALLSLSVGLLGGYVTRTAGDVPPDPAVRWLLGVSVGGLAAGLGASLSRLSPAM